MLTHLEFRSAAFTALGPGAITGGSLRIIWSSFHDPRLYDNMQSVRSEVGIKSITSHNLQFD